MFRGERASFTELSGMRVTMGWGGLNRGRNDFCVGRMGIETEVSRLGRKPCMVYTIVIVSR